MAALLFVLLLLLSAAAWGFLSRLPGSYSDWIEAWVVALALGLGILSYSILALGTLGLLYPVAVFVLLIVPILFVGVLNLRGATLPLLPNGGPVPIRSLSWFDWLVLGTVGILFSMSLCEALHLDRCIDPYHVDFARSYINNRRVSFLPGALVDAYPKGVEMLFVIGVLFDPESAGSVLHLSFLPLSCLALFAALNRTFGKTVAGLAAVWLAGQVILHKVGPMGNVDFGAMFFGTAALVPLSRFLENPDRREACLVGLLGGLALSCKLTALPFFLLPVALTAVLLAVTYPLRDWPRLLSGGALSLVCLVAVLSPWMLRNILNTGSAVAPLAMDTFPLHSEFATGVEIYGKMHPLQISRFLSNPGWSARFYFDQLTIEGVSALTLLPPAVLFVLAYAFWKRSRIAAFWALAASAAFLSYVLCGPKRFPRFAAPAIPLFCGVVGILCGTLLGSLGSRPRNLLTALQSFGLIVAVVLGVREFRGTYFHKPLLTVAQREKARAAEDPSFGRVGYLNRTLTREDRLCLHRTGLRFRHLDMPFCPPPFWGPDRAESLAWKAYAEEPEDFPGALRRLLTEEGITHLLVSRNSLDFPPQILETVEEFPDAILFRIREGETSESG